MTLEKNFVANGSCPLSSDPVATFHIQSFNKLLKDFYDLADLSDHLEVQTELKKSFVESSLDPDKALKQDYVLDMLTLANYQTVFIAALKEKWELIQPILKSKTLDS